MAYLTGQLWIVLRFWSTGGAPEQGTRVKFRVAIGVRAGGAGAAAAPQILGNSDFLGSTRSLGNASF